jgi:hypothetical protein
MSKPPSKRRSSTNKRLEDDSSNTNKKTKSIRDAFLGNKEQVLRSLRLQHKGKRLLLRASTIYGTMARVPEGEENFIFLYIVSEINPDFTTASIEYEGKYVVDGGRAFNTYLPVPDDVEIEQYMKGGVDIIEVDDDDDE